MASRGRSTTRSRVENRKRKKPGGQQAIKKLPHGGQARGPGLGGRLPRQIEEIQAAARQRVNHPLVAPKQQGTKGMGQSSQSVAEQCCLKRRPGVSVEGSVAGSLPHPTKGRAAGFIAIRDAPSAQPSCASLSAMWNRRGLPNPEVPCASDLSSVVTGHDLAKKLQQKIEYGQP
jgi:hypothetical protein